MRRGVCDIYIYISILEWTRAFNARPKLATGEVTATFVDSKRPFALGGSWTPLGLSWAPPGGPWALLGDVLGGSWASLGRSWSLLGCPGRVLALSWASFPGSWAALDRERRLVTKRRKNHGFCKVLGAPGALPGPLGALLAALGRLLGGSWALVARPKWSWVAPG